MRVVAYLLVGVATTISPSRAFIISPVFGSFRLKPSSTASRSSSTSLSRISVTKTNNKIHEALSFAETPSASNMHKAIHDAAVGTTQTESTHVPDSTLNTNNNTSNTAVEELNMALRALATKAGDTRLPVIQIAQYVEQQWRDAPETNATTFYTVLNAWCRCANCLTEQDAATTWSSGISSMDHDTIFMGTEKFHLPVIATTSTDAAPVYTARGAAQRVSDLIQAQEQDDDTLVDRSCYNAAMEAWVKCADAVEQVDRFYKKMTLRGMEPNKHTFQARIDAYAHSDSPDRFEQLQSIRNDLLLRHQPQQTDGQHIEGSKLTTKMMNSILQAYCLVGEKKNHPMTSIQAAQECVVMYNEMKKLFERTDDATIRPDITTLTTVLNALSKCEQVDTTLLAQKLFDDRDDHLQPITFTYTCLMTAWARTKSPESPARTLAYLKMLGPNSNARAYTATIQAHARCNNNDKAVFCWNLLQNMTAVTKPTAVTYQAVVDACGRTTGTPEQQTRALRIAFDAFKQMQRDTNVAMTHHMYRQLLTALQFLLPPGSKERNDLAKAVFKKAAATGYAEDGVVRAFRRTADSSVVQELLGKDNKKFPATWSRRVKR